MRLFFTFTFFFLALGIVSSQEPDLPVKKIEKDILEQEKEEDFGTGKPNSKPVPIFDPTNPSKQILVGDDRPKNTPKNNPPKNNPPPDKYGSAKSNSSPKPIVGVKPNVNYDPKANMHQKKEASKKAFLQKGADQSKIQKHFEKDKIKDRVTRQNSFYRDYRNREIKRYNDHYSDLFFLWLLDRNLREQAAWLYHHRETMDQQRYNDLLHSNSKLHGIIEEMENQNITRDESFVPEGMDGDLMYADMFANTFDEFEIPENLKFILIAIFCVVIFVMLVMILRKKE